MYPAVQTTLSLLLLIGLGGLLKKKLTSPDQLSGIKLLILSIALPATIFVALLKIQVDASLLMLPVLALAFNLLMLGATYVLLPHVGVDRDTPRARTLLLLLPSLAPGLSCFPFVMEYLGDAALAQAALADVGNKVFVLIGLYLLAMHWYHQRSRHTAEGTSRLKELLVALVSEPINLVMIGALLLLGFGLNMQALPGFMQDALLRMSAMMTPMVLLFIGLAVTFRRGEVRLIASLLGIRAGLTLLLSGALVAALGLTDPATILLAAAFPLSACSFWPFAHLSAVAALEKNDGSTPEAATFDPDFALTVLAMSLPFSTLLILGLFSSGTAFADPTMLLAAGGAFLAVAGLPWVGRSWWQKRSASPADHPTPEAVRYLQELPQEV